MLCAILGAVPRLSASPTRSARTRPSQPSASQPRPPAPGRPSPPASPTATSPASCRSSRAPTRSRRQAKKLGGGVLARPDRLEQLTVEQEPSADIITVKATAGRPEVGHGHRQRHCRRLHHRARHRSAARAPRIQTLQDKLGTITTQLTTPDTGINAQITAAMKDLIARANEAGSTGYVPNESLVVPGLVQQRDALNAEYNRVLQAKERARAQRRRPVGVIAHRAGHAPSSPQTRQDHPRRWHGPRRPHRCRRGAGARPAVVQGARRGVGRPDVGHHGGRAFPASRALLDNPLAALKTTPADAHLRRWNG